MLKNQIKRKMKFQDLEFNTHTWENRGVHATITTDKGYSISVAAGYGFYSTPGGIVKEKEAFKVNPKASDFVSFEVAVKDKNLPIEEQEWKILGWQREEDITQILKDYSK